MQNTKYTTFTRPTGTRLTPFIVIFLEEKGVQNLGCLVVQVVYAFSKSKFEDGISINFPPSLLTLL